MRNDNRARESHRNVRVHRTRQRILSCLKRELTGKETPQGVLFHSVLAIPILSDNGIQRIQNGSSIRLESLAEAISADKWSEIRPTNGAALRHLVFL